MQTDSQTETAPPGSLHPAYAPMFSSRELRLSELRGKWAIKQQQAAQLASAIEVLANPKMQDRVALKVADKILNANIGP